MKKLHKRESNLISIEVTVDNFAWLRYKGEGVSADRVYRGEPYDANYVLRSQLYLEWCPSWMGLDAFQLVYPISTSPVPHPMEW